MQPVCEFSELSRSFTQKTGFFGAKREIFAVNQVNLRFYAGKTLALVGESGCGKSTLARMAVRLLTPTSGDVLFEGNSLFHPSQEGHTAKNRTALCQKIQMIFQDPFSSLNPRMRIGESVAEPLLCTSASAQEREAATVALLERVGLGREHLRRYPHEFSGGQRQRIAIARALVTHPSFVVCDEPTSSLDSSVQAQVLNLLAELQEQLTLTYLLISHDLAVVRHMSDRVAVMYAGFIVEEADTATLFTTARHPYTHLLLESVPTIRGKKASSACLAPGEGVPRGYSPLAENVSSSPAPAIPGANISHASSPDASGLPQHPLLDSNSGLPATEGTPSGTQPFAGQQRGVLPEKGCPFAPRCPRCLACCHDTLPQLMSTPEDASALVRCHNPFPV